MRALVTDYDGTLARRGVVARSTRDALDRWPGAGHAVLIVTGRTLDDLVRVFPDASRCTRLVVENGARLVDPEANASRLLAEPPSRTLLDRFREASIPFDRGEVVVAFDARFDATARPIVEAFGWTIVRNLDSSMALPRGVDKGSGVRAAFAELGVDPRDAIAIGDAENDLPLLEACATAIAPANAIAAVKAKASWVAEGRDGEAVVEAIARTMASRADERDQRAQRNPR